MIFAESRWFVRVLFMVFTCAVGVGNGNSLDRPSKSSGTEQQAVADMVIFSFDRPMQLYALLESMKKFVTGLGSVQIIYRTSDTDFRDAYEIVKQSFPDFLFVAQGPLPHGDFKPLTLRAVFDSPHEYVIFAVDDIIVKDFIDLNECANALEKYQGYGFYLRLGLNVTESYAENRRLQLPRMGEVEKGIFSWRFSDGRDDWNYPHSVDMTVYRKNDIEPALRSLSYKTPYTLENSWASIGKKFSHRVGLCYEQSKIVGLPLNVVQTEWNNRHMNFLNAKELLTLFMSGKKIDIKPFKKIQNKGAHMAYEPTFIER